MILKIKKYLFVQDFKVKNLLGPKKNITSLKSATPANILVIATAILIVFSLSGTVKLWDNKGPVIFGGALIPSVVSIFLALGAILKSSERFDRQLLNLSYYLVPTLILTVLVSNWFSLDYNFFQNTYFKGEFIICFLISSIITKSNRFMKYFAVGTSVLFIGIFINYLKSNIILSDDHSSFLYRLILLKKEFPNIPFYYPLWNEGLDQRDFFATGAIGYFILYSLLIYPFSILFTYNIILGIHFFILSPALYYFCVKKVLLYPTRTALLSATLSMAISLGYYKWALQYGTLGFLTSIALLPLAVSILIKFFNSKYRISNNKILASTIILTLYSLWPLASLLIAPVYLIVLSKVFANKRTKNNVIILFILLLVFNLPWMLMFVKVSKVINFVGITQQENQTPIKTRKVFADSTSNSWSKKITHHVRQEAHQTNPLILFAGIVGIFYLRKMDCLIYLSLTVWLSILGTFGAFIKPQLELDRALVVLTCLLCLPAAVIIDRTLRLSYISKSSLPTYASNITFGTLLATLLVIPSILTNRTTIQFSKMNLDWEKTVRYISRNNQGRTLYLGCVLHELNQAHLAPLTELTQSSIIASSPFHNIWWYTDSIPLNVRKSGRNEILKYLDSMNVGLVAASEKKWKSFLYKDKGFEYTGKAGSFIFFKKKGFVSNYSQSGNLEDLEIKSSSISFVPKSNEIKLKFNWYPFLSTNNCNIAEYKNDFNKPYISLTNCVIGKRTYIKSVNPISRFFQ